MNKAKEREAIRQRIIDERENRGYYRCKLLQEPPETTQGKLRARLVCGMLVFEREMAKHLRQHGLETVADPMQFFELVRAPTYAETLA